MDRMLLYPPNSSMAFIPAAFIPSVQPGSSFIMTNCTVTTLCNTLAAYRNAFLDTTSTNTLAVSHVLLLGYCLSGALPDIPCTQFTGTYGTK